MCRQRASTPIRRCSVGAPSCRRRRAAGRRSPRPRSRRATLTTALEADLLEELGRPQRAEAALADRVDRAVARQLVQPRGQLGLRQIDRARHVAVGVLLRLAHVEHERASARARSSASTSTSSTRPCADVSIAQGRSARPRLVASMAVMFSGRAGTPSVRLATKAAAVQPGQRVVQALEADGRARPAAHPLAAGPLEVAGEDGHPVRQAQQAGQALVLLAPRRRRRSRAGRRRRPAASRRSAPSTARGCAAG